MVRSLLSDWPVPGVLRVRLNRSATRNALDSELVDALFEAFDTEGARAIVLASTDPAAFSSGADLLLADEERRTVSDRLYELYGKITGASAIVIVALDGPAIGAGAQLAAAADLRLASERASIRFPGPGHGLAVGAWVLPSLIGRGRALDLCLSMRTIDAAEAHAIGLVDKLAEDPEEAAVTWGAEIAALDVAATARTKRIIAAAGRLETTLAQERRQNYASWDGSVRVSSVGALDG